MKILAFADLHLDVPFSWAREPVARMRRANRRRTLENIIALAQAESVDALLCAGDLFEQDRITPDTFEFLRGTFAPALRACDNPIAIACLRLFTSCRIGHF